MQLLAYLQVPVNQGLKPFLIPSHVFVLAFHDKGGVFSHLVPKGFVDPHGRLGIDNFDENTMSIELC